MTLRPPRLPVQPGSTLASAPRRLLLLRRRGPPLLGPEALGVSRGGRRAPQRNIQGLGTCADPLLLWARARESPGEAEDTNSTAVSLDPDVK